MINLIKVIYVSNIKSIFFLITGNLPDFSLNSGSLNHNLAELLLMTAAQKWPPQQVKLLMEGREGDYVNEYLSVFFLFFIICELSHRSDVNVELLELVSPSREDRCLSSV